MKPCTFGSLFSGGGLVDLGAVAAGLQPRWAIEIDPAVAGVFRANHNTPLIEGDVAAIDPNDLDPVEVLWASPPCQAFSQARNQSLPQRTDADLGLHILRYTAVPRPRLVVVENVPAYQHSDQLAQIVAGLWEQSYFVCHQLLNASWFGTPQTRHRLILRAFRGSLVPELRTSAAKAGWWSAVADLADSFPPSQLAPWQLKKLFPLEHFLGEANTLIRGCGPNQRGPWTVGAGRSAPTVIACADKITLRAWLVDGQFNGSPDQRDRPPTVRRGDEPAYTITSSGALRPARACLDGRVVALTTRALARFQDLPDTYQLPANKTLACKVIGNGVPVRMAAAILRGMA